MSASIMISVPEEVYEYLDYLGIQQHLLGYNFIAYGVKYLIDNLDRSPRITKEVYPEIAKVFNSTPHRVERGVRHAITAMFDEVDIDIIYEVFGNSTDSETGMLTNSQFLYAIARKILRKSKDE